MDLLRSQVNYALDFATYNTLSGSVKLLNIFLNYTFVKNLMHCDFSRNPYHQKKPKDDGGENSRLVEHNDQIRFSYLAIKLGA